MHKGTRIQNKTELDRTGKAVARNFKKKKKKNKLQTPPGVSLVAQ